jgi:hypothetical protein
VGGDSSSLGMELVYIEAVMLKGGRVVHQGKKIGRVDKKSEVYPLPAMQEGVTVVRKF